MAKAKAKKVNKGAPKVQNQLTGKDYLKRVQASITPSTQSST